jgi:CRISPR/Cas system CSM-associated protein Csm3 (group 7 of RAMP superfamily)
MGNELYRLRFVLESDATFGRGEGVVGLVDSEVEHNGDGLPYLRGKTLKGLLHEECKNILFALESQGHKMDAWRESEERLFGRPGSTLDDKARMHVKDAQLPAELRRGVHYALTHSNGKMTETEVLESLTCIRRQTAIDEITRAPLKGSLRAMRVISRGLPFAAELTFMEAPTERDLALLSACVLAFRRAGTARNRGRGRLHASLYDAEGHDITQSGFQAFRRFVEAEGDGKA